MGFLRFIIGVFRSYDYYDKLISALAILFFLLMLLKLSVFPYGLFNFGEANIYTEGLVSRNGIQNLNPLFIDYNEADREVSALIFSSLMKYDPDKGSVVEDMATLSINEEKTEYTLTLRDGLKWHDGEPLTADDVFFTFHDVIMSSFFPNEILKANFAGVRVEQVDEYSVTFILDKPNIFFLANLTTGILPMHILGEVPPHELLQHEFNKMPIGSGSYKIKEPAAVFSDDRMQITLEKNPYYYSAPSEIELLRFIVYPTMEQLLAEATAVNGVVKISGDYIQEFKKQERFELIPYQLPQYTGVFFNMESELLKDNEKVRLALQKAVDKEILMGEFPDKVAVDTPLMELNQEDWVYQASVEQAQGALKDAGFEYVDDDADKTGFRYDEDGNPLRLRFAVRLYEEGTAQFEETKTVIIFLEESWENIGFDIEIELLPLEGFKQRIMERDYDLLLVGQSLGYNLDTYSYWHSTQADMNGQNLSNYKSFQVDSLIENIRSLFDDEKREEKLNELAEKIKDDIPAIFLYRPVYYYALDGKITGLNMRGVVFPTDRFSRLGEWNFGN